MSEWKKPFAYSVWLIEHWRLVVKVDFSVVIVAVIRNCDGGRRMTWEEYFRLKREYDRRKQKWSR